MNKYIDLHCHSTFSDGDYNVDELVQIAKEQNVGLFSITDHDKVDSCFHKISDDDITMVNGIELSTYYIYNNKMCYIHLLGYDYNPYNKKLLYELKRMREILIDDSTKFVNFLLNKKLPLPSSVIEQIDVSSYRLIQDQLRSVILKNGYDEKYYQYINSIIKDDYPLYDDYEIELSKAIDIILESGGIPVLAHPNRIHIAEAKKDSLIKELKNKGLMGIESNYSYYKDYEFGFYSEIAQKYSLLESVGSDFHFYTEKNNVNIGSGINSNLLKEDCSLKRVLIGRSLK